MVTGRQTADSLCSEGDSTPVLPIVTPFRTSRLPVAKRRPTWPPKPLAARARVHTPRGTRRTAQRTAPVAAPSSAS